MHKVILIFLLVSSVVYAGEVSERRGVLVKLLDEIYSPDEASQNKSQEIKKINVVLSSQLSTCPLLVVGEESSDFMKAISCETFVEGAKEAGVSRIQVKNALLKRDSDESSAETEDQREKTLLAVLDELYGPEDSEKVRERAELIKHFQTCEYASGAIDGILSIFKTFGCESFIEIAHETRISYFDMEEAVSAALPDDERGEVTLSEREESQSEEKSSKRKVRKP